MRVLVVNAGSSSVKLRLLDGADRIAGERDLEAPEAVADERELAIAVADLGAPDVAGHRIVHGGHDRSRPVLVDDRVVTELASLTDLAPLHQPKSLAALEAVRRALPDVPAVACFDTAFHASLPAAAATYALPAAWRDRWRLRRFGFHGLSHAYASRRAAELTGASRIVVCHLGAGASVCAVRDGRSADTTMGFTPLEGLVMATRSGSVDPGLLMWLLERGSLSPHEMAEALEHESGMMGLAGTGDMRAVVVRAEQGEETAALALDVYVHRLAGQIAAMAAAIGGVEALVFTGRVGERSAAVREMTAARLGFLGVGIDAARNASLSGDGDVGSGEVPVLVMESREDLEIARQSRAAIATVAPP